MSPVQNRPQVVAGNRPLDEAKSASHVWLRGRGASPNFCLASQPYESAHSFGWGAALILIILVLAMSVGLRMLAYKKGFRIKPMSI